MRWTRRRSERDSNRWSRARRGLPFRITLINLRSLFLRGKKQLPSPQGAGVRMPFAPPSSLFAVFVVKCSPAESGCLLSHKGCQDEEDWASFEVVLGFGPKRIRETSHRNPNCTRRNASRATTCRAFQPPRHCPSPCCRPCRGYPYLLDLQRGSFKTDMLTDSL